MVQQVAVVDAFNDVINDVAARAEASFQKNMAEYRRLVAKMADTGGALPQDEANELIRICEVLGIPPEQLSSDTVAVTSVRDLEKSMADVERRNAERRAPLADLRRKWEESQKRYSEVREQWEKRLKEAERDTIATRREYETLLNARMESTDTLERKLMDAREWRPHLFGPITRESLKQSLDTRRVQTIR